MLHERERVGHGLDEWCARDGRRLAAEETCDKRRRREGSRLVRSGNLKPLEEAWNRRFVPCDGCCVGVDGGGLDIDAAEALITTDQVHDELANEHEKHPVDSAVRDAFTEVVVVFVVLIRTARRRRGVLGRRCCCSVQVFVFLVWVLVLCITVARRIVVVAAAVCFRRVPVPIVFLFLVVVLVLVLIGRVFAV